MIALSDCLGTGKFKLEYIESEIDNPNLWESHCHTQFEMIAVSEGNITVILEGRNCCLKKNQVIIIPPLSYHSVTVNEGERYCRITALFDVNAIPGVLQSEFAGKETDAVIFFSQNVDKLKELCQKDNVLFYAPLVQSLMIQLFYDSLKKGQSVDVIDTDEFLQNTLQYIEGHLHEKILLDDLARHTARSKSSFCHLFEKKMNISPKQYILQKKLAVAMKMINEGTPRTVAAMQVGYENYSNFYRLCQKNV